MPARRRNTRPIDGLAELDRDRIGERNNGHVHLTEHDFGPHGNALWCVWCGRSKLQIHRNRIFTCDGREQHERHRRSREVSYLIVAVTTATFALYLSGLL